MVDGYFECCCMEEFAGYSWSEGKTSSQLEKCAGDVVVLAWTVGSSAEMITASVVEESAGEVHVEKLLAPLCNPRHPDEAKNSEVGGTEELPSHSEMMDPMETHEPRSRRRCRVHSEMEDPVETQKLCSRRSYRVHNGHS